MKKSTLTVDLNGVDKVKNFVNLAYGILSDMELGAGKYIVDAKSIMGIFSLDLSKPVQLHVNADEEGYIRKILADFIVQ